jgi:hypothetical protein
MIIFQIIEPKEFQKSFAKCMKSRCKITPCDIIAIDGKTLKGSFKKKTDPTVFI